MDKEPPGFTFFEFLDVNLLIGILVIFILLFLTAIVSGAEVAFFSLSQNQIDDAATKDPEKIKIISKLLQKHKKLLATFLVANNSINISIVILFFYFGDNLFSNINVPIFKFIVQIITVTFLILLFGEVIPKVYANRNNIKFAKMVVFPISFLNKLLFS